MNPKENCSDTERSDRTSVIFVEVPCPDEELAKVAFQAFTANKPEDRDSFWRGIASAVRAKVREGWEGEKKAHDYNNLENARILEKVMSERDVLKAEVELLKQGNRSLSNEITLYRKERDEARAELASLKATTSTIIQWADEGQHVVESVMIGGKRFVPEAPSDPEAGGRALFESIYPSSMNYWICLTKDLRDRWIDLAARLEGGGK